MTSATETNVDTVSTDATVITNVAERLSFFFSDANLRNDRFMQKQLIRERERDFGGSLSTETLLRFKTIQQYTTDSAVLLEAAKTLPEFLVVDTDQQTIARKVPMTKGQRDDNIPVSIYVTNIPVQDHRYTVNAQTDLRPLFERYGTVKIVKLKWIPQQDDPDDVDNNEKANDDDEDNKKGYKKRKVVPAGSCIVEFSSVEEMEAAVKDLVGDPPSLDIEVNGQRLVVQRLKDWIDSRKAQTSSKSNANGDSHPSSEKKKRTRDEETPKEENGNHNQDSITENSPGTPSFTMDWKPGCVISLTGLDATTCDRESLRDAVLKDISESNKDDDTKESVVVYADYSRGQTEGALRFTEPSDWIRIVADKLQKGDLQIHGHAVETARVLEGEEEKSYWQKFLEFKNRQVQQKADEKFQKRKRNASNNYRGNRQQNNNKRRR